MYCGLARSAAGPGPNQGSIRPEHGAGRAACSAARPSLARAACAPAQAPPPIPAWMVSCDMGPELISAPPITPASSSDPTAAQVAIVYPCT